jgi:hypothetical protein
MMNKRASIALIATSFLAGFSDCGLAQVVTQSKVVFGADVPNPVRVAAYEATRINVELSRDEYDIEGDPFAKGRAMWLGTTSAGNALRATFVTDKPGADDFLNVDDVYKFTFVLSALAPGEYTIELALAGQPSGPVSISRTVIVALTPPTIVATSMGQRPTGKFFITASPQELTVLSALTGDGASDKKGLIWGVAEQTINVWPATGNAPTAAKPVCRLYHPQAVTHFYSANEADCALVRKTAPWIDEGIAFKALTPSNGACPVGTDAVYRLFSATLGNHVYTRSTATITAFGQTGWANEGVVFCSPKN